MKTSKYGFLIGAAAVVTAALTCVLAAGTAMAGPQATTTYGDQFTWMGAEAAAMGGSGAAVYRGGLSNVFNPAFLVVEKDTRFDAGVMLDQEHEDRFQPLYDSFDSYVAQAAIASNRNHFWQSGFGLAKRVGEGDRAVSIGISLADRFPYAYRFYEEVRNPYPGGSPYPTEDVPRDMIIAIREREVTGTLRALSFGVAAETSERVSIGAAVHYNYGTRLDVSSSVDLDDAGTDNSYRTSDELKLAGVSASAGLRAQVSERVDLGVAVESGIKATGDWRQQDVTASAGTDTTMSAFYDYPWCVRAGLAFRPRNELPTVFTLEIEYRPWSELRDGTLADTTPILNDATDVKMGVEHVFHNGMPLRFGFRYIPSYADRDAAVTAFTAGTGARVGNGRLSASVELAKTSSLLPHQFPYPADYFGVAYEVDPMARVDDTRFRLGVTYTMEF